MIPSQTYSTWRFSRSELKEFQADNTEQKLNQIWPTVRITIRVVLKSPVFVFFAFKTY